MARGVNVHILDLDPSRRREITCHLAARSLPAQQHAGLADFLSHPRRGVALIAHDFEDAGPARALEAISEHSGCLPVALYATDLPPYRILQAMAAGAADCFEWPCDPARLGQIVASLVVHGKRRGTVASLEAHAREQVARLSVPEREVLRLLMTGAGAHQIAAALNLRTEAMAVQRAQVLRRLEAPSLADAVRIGIYAGMAEAGPAAKGATRARRPARATDSAAR